MADDRDELGFEILVRPVSGSGSGGGPARPDPGTVERLRIELAGRGITCHATAFGLVCSAPRAVVGRVFGAASASAGPGDSIPVPPDLAAVVEQVTVPMMPETFP